MIEHCSDFPEIKTGLGFLFLSTLGRVVVQHFDTLSHHQKGCLGVRGRGVGFREVTVCAVDIRKASSNQG